jgi:hypothetical protein
MRNIILFVILLFGCEPPMVAEELENVMGQRSYFSRSGTVLVRKPGNGLSFQCSLPQMGVYTVQFNLSPPRRIPASAGVPAPVLNTRAIAKATIDWTVSGNYVRRVVHVADGMSVTGTGEAVSVNISDESIAYGVGAANPTAYDVSITVSEGSRASSPNPPYLQHLGASGNGVHVSPGNQTDITVPADIGASSIYVPVDYDTGVFVAEGHIQLRQLVDAVQVMGCDPRRNQWVPLVPGVTTIRLQVVAAAAGGVVMTPFWGIDG